MTIPKAAIKKAMEGGWNDANGAASLDLQQQPHFAALIVLDPSFWQALGKALGWKQDIAYVDYRGRRVEWRAWRKHALRFYGLILNGQDTQSFWDELLK